jgi:hypothetical protein
MHGVQIRMARAALRWSVAKLAKRAKLDPSTVKRVEATLGSAQTERDLEWRAERRMASLEAITATLQRAGIAFFHDAGGVGVRLKKTGAISSCAEK